jgi:hypothetical protein
VIRGLALFAVAVFLLACDPTHRVRIVNTTQQQVVLYEDAHTPSISRTLAPGADVTLNWMYDSSQPDATPLREVRATTVSAALIFCHRYTYGELRSNGWEIPIREEVQCG